MASRFKWGPDLGVIGGAPPAPTRAPSLDDVDPIYDSALTNDPKRNPAGDIYFDLPAYDPKSRVQFDAIHVVLYDQAEAPPIDPADVLTWTGALLSSADVPYSPEGAQIVIPRPAGALPDRKYNAKTVLEFQDEAALAPVPTAAPTPTTTPPAAPAPPT